MQRPQGLLPGSIQPTITPYNPPDSISFSQWDTGNCKNCSFVGYYPLIFIKPKQLMEAFVCRSISWLSRLLFKSLYLFHQVL